MEDIKKGQLLVAALESGTVIDHISTDKVFKIVQLLSLDKSEDSVTISNNLVSTKMGRKGLIKVAGRFFTDEEISRLSVVCPNIHLSIIKDFKVVEKKTIELPETLKNVVKCANPVCITNNEPMKTIFNVIDKDAGILKCHYCGKTQCIENIKLI
jgi:aspartate carbamoyltransferase regulatory subunit